MNCKVLFFIIFFIQLGFSPFVFANKKPLKCVTSLEAISKENALSGATVLVQKKMGPKSINGMEATFESGLPLMNPDSFLETLAFIKADDELEIVRGAHKIQGIQVVRVKHLKSGKEGLLYWSEFKFSTRLKSVKKKPETFKPVNKPKKPQLKFSLKQDPMAGEKGLTRYGRPYPKSGDFVWEGNPSKIMNPKNIGRLPPKSDPIKPSTEQKFVEIEFINGETDIADTFWLTPLTPEEVDLVLSTYKDSITVDWFHN